MRFATASSSCLPLIAAGTGDEETEVPTAILGEKAKGVAQMWLASAKPMAMLPAIPGKSLGSRRFQRRILQDRRRFAACEKRSGLRRHS
mmetsp:Transcript_13123/g.37764  ORF Transcript_13123/g.37764 Transcript_13123/m.37764 type:complete len:89 (-) Transcript_13123:12-278(-)